MRTIKLSFLLILINGLFSLSIAQSYDVVTSSYLGGSEDDEITGVEIQSDGTIIVTGMLSFQSHSGVDPIYLGGASTSSKATVVRLSSAGDSIISITKLKEGFDEIADISLDGNDRIYLALNKNEASTSGAGYICKLSSNADTLLFSNEDNIWTTIDASPQGYFATVGGWDKGTWSPNTVRFYSPTNEIIYEKFLPEMGVRDASIFEEERKVIVNGFNIKWMGIAEYHLSFYIAYGFNGAKQYTGYNWEMKDWIPRWAANRVRPYIGEVGQDGKFYTVAAWTGKLPNFNNFDPFDKFVEVDPAGGDTYHTYMIGSGQDQKKKASFSRFNPEDGSIDTWNNFTALSNDGANTVTIRNQNAMAVDPDGIQYYAVISAYGFPDLTLNPTGTSGNEGANILVMSKDMTTRLLTAKIGGGAYEAIALKQLNGTKIIVAAGHIDSDGGSDPYLLNAIQSTGKGGDDGYFCVINSPENTTVPSPPNNLQLSQSSARGILFSWDDNADNEDGFIIERSVNSGSFEKLLHVYPDQTSFRDMAIQPETSYEYRVAAFNQEGNSSYTATISTTIASPALPSAPGGLEATPISENEIRLTWSAVEAADGYLIEGKAWDNQNFESMAEIEGNTDYNAKGLKAGTEYHFRIRSFNDDGLSDYSNTIVISTENLPLQEPANPESTTSGLCYTLYNKTKNLSNWSDFSDTTELVFIRDGYYDNMDPYNQCQPEYIPEEADFAFKYFGYIEVPKDGTYEFTIDAAKQAMLFINDGIVVDNSTWKWGSWREKGQVGLKAGKHKFTLEFIQSYSKGAPPELIVKIKGPDMEEQIIPDNILFRDTDCIDKSEVPDTPTNLITTELSGNMVMLNWDDNADNEGLYAIEITPVNWDTYLSMVEILRLPKNTDSYLLINIEPGEYYNVRVRAMNEAGYSDYSNMDSIRTSLPISNAPAPPDLLTINYTTSDQISLSWRDNANNESQFVIEYKSEGDSSFSEARTVSENITTTTISGLTPETNYIFRVKAVNYYGNSDYSNEASDSTIVNIYKTPDNKEHHNVLVYPNPVHNYVYISLSLSLKEDVTVSLINLKGQRVKNIIFPARTGLVKLNMSDLMPGIYIVDISSVKGIQNTQEIIFKE